MAHSNQLREFVMTKSGIELIPAYIGKGGVLTGSSRLAQQAKERADEEALQEEAHRRIEESKQKRLALQAQITALQAELGGYERASEKAELESENRESRGERDRKEMTKSRRAAD